jgi:hypothetical protein
MHHTPVMLLLGILQTCAGRADCSMKVPNDGYDAACDIVFQAGSYTTALKLYNSVKTV